MTLEHKGVLGLLLLYALGVSLFPDNLADIRVLLFVAGGLIVWSLLLQVGLPARRPQKKASNKKASRKKGTEDDIPPDPTMADLSRTLNAMSQGVSYKKSTSKEPAQMNLWGNLEPVRKPESDSGDPTTFWPSHH